MSGVIYGEPSEELIAQLIGHEDPRARLLGRLIATGTTDSIQRWMHAEIERGTESADLVIVLTRFAVMLVGAVVRPTVKEGREQSVCDSCGAAFGKALAEHLRVARELGLRPGEAAHG